MRIVNEHDDASPLFLYLAFAAIHSPIAATPSLLARVDALRGSAYFEECSWFNWLASGGTSPLPARGVDAEGGSTDVNGWCVGSIRRILEAMALALDDAIGALVRAVQSRPGMWDSSLFVFLSDNGGAFEQQVCMCE